MSANSYDDDELSNMDSIDIRLMVGKTNEDVTIANIKNMVAIAKEECGVGEEVEVPWRSNQFRTLAAGVLGGAWRCISARRAFAYATYLY